LARFPQLSVDPSESGSSPSPQVPFSAVLYRFFYWLLGVLERRLARPPVHPTPVGGLSPHLALFLHFGLRCTAPPPTSKSLIGVSNFYHCVLPPPPPLNGPQKPPHRGNPFPPNQKSKFFFFFFVARSGFDIRFSLPFLWGHVLSFEKGVYRY